MAARSITKPKKVLLWLAFSVIFALGPIFINSVILRVHNAAANDIDWWQLFDQGELFLISGALCADAVGRMWAQKAQSSYLSIFCLIACLFVLFTTSIEFGVGAESGRLASLRVDSLVWFGIAIMAGLGAVLAED